MVYFEVSGIISVTGLLITAFWGVFDIVVNESFFASSLLEAIGELFLQEKSPIINKSDKYFIFLII
jgi:hypothetical protein